MRYFLRWRTEKASYMNKSIEQAVITLNTVIDGLRAKGIRVNGRFHAIDDTYDYGMPINDMLVFAEPDEDLIESRVIASAESEEPDHSGIRIDLLKEDATEDQYFRFMRNLDDVADFKCRKRVTLYVNGETFVDAFDYGTLDALLVSGNDKPGMGDKCWLQGGTLYFERMTPHGRREVAFDVTCGEHCLRPFIADGDRNFLYGNRYREEVARWEAERYRT